MVPVAIEFMDKLAIHTCEQFAGAGYPLDVEAMLIIEVEGSSEEMTIALERIETIATHTRDEGLASQIVHFVPCIVDKGEGAAIGTQVITLERS